MSSLPEYSLTSQNGLKTHQWKNVNWPAGDARFLGGKAGYLNEAGETMAGVYKVKFAEYGERPVAIVVLGSHDRVADVNAVIAYRQDRFVYGNVLAEPDQNRATILRTGANIYEAVGGVFHW